MNELQRTDSQASREGGAPDNDGVVQTELAQTLVSVVRDVEHVRRHFLQRIRLAIAGASENPNPP